MGPELGTGDMVRTFIAREEYPVAIVPDVDLDTPRGIALESVHIECQGLDQGLPKEVGLGLPVANGPLWKYFHNCPYGKLIVMQSTLPTVGRKPLGDRLFRLIEA